MEDNLRWKGTMDARRPIMEDNHGWKTPLDGRQPWMEQDLEGQGIDYLDYAGGWVQNWAKVDYIIPGDP